MTMSPILKYVRLTDDSIIIFPTKIRHDVFLHLNPIHAGYCDVSPEEMKVTCGGEIKTLRLESASDKDTALATLQVFGKII